MQDVSSGLKKKRVPLIYSKKFFLKLYKEFERDCGDGISAVIAVPFLSCPGFNYGPPPLLVAGSRQRLSPIVSVKRECLHW